MRNYRQVVPRYRKTLNEIYWRLRDCDPCHPTDQDLAQTGRLFGSSTLTDMIAFSSVFPFLAFLNMGVLGWVNRKAPALLNLLVGRGTSTAQLGERMWELRQVAVQCSAETVDLLRRGEMDLAKYRIIPEAAPLLEASKRFIRTYGHRAFRYASEFEATRLADQPELALLTIGGLLEESEPPAVRAEAARQLGYQTLHKMDPFRRLFWQRILKWGSTLIERREECRDTLELQNATYGLAATVLSRHHFPNQPPDYLWLYTFEEFLSFGQSRGQKRVAPEEIERRRAELERNRRQAAPPPARAVSILRVEASVSENVPAQVLVLDDLGQLLPHIIAVDLHRLLPQVRPFEREIFEKLLHDGVQAARSDVLSVLVDPSSEAGHF